MTKELILFIILALAVGFKYSAKACESSIHDQIDMCNVTSDPKCLRNILHQLVHVGGTGSSVSILAGEYKSESFTMTIVIAGNAVKISGSSNISERGDYVCEAFKCTGEKYSFEILGPTKIKMNYGRIWEKS